MVTKFCHCGVAHTRRAFMDAGRWLCERCAQRRDAADTATESAKTARLGDDLQALDSPVLMFADFLKARGVV